MDKKKFKMLGRKNVDMIKSGGYKISALEVESALLGHPSIKDCSVIAVADETWGQRVVAVIAAGKDGENGVQEDELVRWAAEKLPKYSVPKEWR